MAGHTSFQEFPWSQESCWGAEPRQGCHHSSLGPPVAKGMPHLAQVLETHAGEAPSGDETHVGEATVGISSVNWQL